MEANQGKYAINWQTAFQSVQTMLLDKYVEKTYSSHHLRVVRILRSQGYLEEKDLTKFTLLPQKNLRAILCQLICDGVICSQEVPQSMKSSVSGPIYGLSFQGRGLLDAYRSRVVQSILNLVVKVGKLGPMHGLCVEMNHMHY